MANQEHLDILKQGVETWNQWRQEHLDILPDLKDAKLSNVNLRGADLSGANLIRADLNRVILNRATLIKSKLNYANLSDAELKDTVLLGADLSDATLHRAIFRDTDLSNTRLLFTDFTDAILTRADFSHASVLKTIFGNNDLRSAMGLDTMKHRGPSVIGIDTFYRSEGNIPEVFLRHAGIPESFITYMRSLVGKPLDFYSCFISYSSKDQAFVERLYADLQSKGVRCWFAPEDIDIGDKLRARIDETIRMYDKLLLVLSEHSIVSTWVAYEIDRALSKEPEGIPNVLYPIRLDDIVMRCKTGWAEDIRLTRHIGDFSNWKNHDEYQKAFKRLLRALKAEARHRL